MNDKLKLNVSRLRWGLAVVLAALALVAAVQSIRTYQAHEMTTGLMAVVALAVLLVVGMVSLAQARLRIGHELHALRAAARGDASNGQPVRPAGAHTGAPTRARDSELLAARRLRLDAIRAAGVRPDGDVLADATRADEAGRAYIGRYLVATTVLIGLVGTFAGLMQTLGKMAPLLADKGGGDIALLVTPLAGLHVTFGASLVAILSTLALALAQGDLALGEEQALALLEDHTKHNLIPRLWPGGDDSGDRTVRAVEDLKAVFTDTLARSIDISIKNISESASAQAERSARALEKVAATIEKDVTRLCETVQAGLAQGVLRQTEALADTTREHGEVLAQTTATVSARLAEAASTLMAQLRVEVAGAITRSAEAGNAALAAASAAAGEAVARTTNLAEEVSRRSTVASEEAGRRAATAVEELSRSAASALADSMARTAVVLEESVQRATNTAAQLMRGTTEASERASQATTEAVTRTLEPLLSGEAERLDGVREALAEVGMRVDATAGRLVELTSGLEGLARAHIDSIDRSGQAVLAAFDRALVGGGAALDAAAGTLGTAARDLQASAETLAPRLATLTTELGALSREVALLAAARGPDGGDLDLGAVVLGELDRLGGSVERLTALMHLADPDGSAAEAPAHGGEASAAPGEGDGERTGEGEGDGEAAAALGTQGTAGPADFQARGDEGEMPTSGGAAPGAAAEAVAELEGDLDVGLTDGEIPPQASQPTDLRAPLDRVNGDETADGLFAVGADQSAEERDGEQAAPPLEEDGGAPPPLPGDEEETAS